MIPPVNIHGFGPQGHEGEQQRPDLRGVLPTVAEVAVEQEAVARGRDAHLNRLKNDVYV